MKRRELSVVFVTTALIALAVIRSATLAGRNATEPSSTTVDTQNGRGSHATALSVLSHGGNARVVSHEVTSILEAATQDSLSSRASGENGAEEPPLGVPGECEASKQNDTYVCEYVNTVCSSESRIDYLSFHFCNDRPGVTIAVLCAWLVVLFYVLALITDEYFVPVLETITEKLNLPHHLAGITFLAFGNGAPDIFAAIAAAGDGSDDMMFGALAGAGMFITTVIIAAVGLAQPFTVHRRPFIRDLAFYFFCTAWLGVVLLQKQITLFTSIAFIAYYFVYVAVVVVARWIYQGQKARAIARGELLVPSAGAGGVAALTPPQGHDPDEEEPAGLSSLQQEARRLLKTDAVDLEDLEDFWYLHQSKALFPGNANGTAESSHVLERLAQYLGWDDAGLVDKFLFPARALASIAADLTCPLYRKDEEYSRGWAAVQLVFGSLFAVWAMGLEQTEVGAELVLWQVVLMVTSVAAAGLFATTRDGKLPALNPALVTLAFLSSVLWIYLIADELVAVLKTLGIILDINRVILGLTILAWGNSVPDLVANYLVAKNGYPLLAMAACFGGPLMNQALGVGVSMLFKTLDGKPYAIDYDVNTIILFIGLGLSLLASAVYFPLNKWTSSKPYCYAMCALYAVFLVASIIAAFGNPVIAS